MSSFHGDEGALKASEQRVPPGCARVLENEINFKTVSLKKYRFCPSDSLGDCTQFSIQFVCVYLRAVKRKVSAGRSSSQMNSVSFYCQIKNGTLDVKRHALFFFIYRQTVGHFGLEFHAGRPKCYGQHDVAESVSRSLLDLMNKISRSIDNSSEILKI